MSTCQGATSSFRYPYRYNRVTGPCDGIYAEYASGLLWSSRPSDESTGKWDESSAPPSEPEATVVLLRVAQIKKNKIRPRPWEDVLDIVAADWATSPGDFPSCFIDTRRRLGKIYVAAGENSEEQRMAQISQAWVQQMIQRLKRIENEARRALFESQEFLRNVKPVTKRMDSDAGGVPANDTNNAMV